MLLSYTTLFCQELSQEVVASALGSEKNATGSCQLGLGLYYQHMRGC
jgi:hypothetical protein